MSCYRHFNRSIYFSDRLLAPVFTNAIAYTQFEGVEFADYKPVLSSPVEKFKALFNIPDDSLAEKFPSSILNKNKTIRVETKHYIITVKDNPQSSYDLDPRQHLNNGSSCQNLTIERKGSRINDEILSINFLDYEKPDLNNIYIVHNALTDDDKQQLMRLQKSVARIKAEHQKAWDDAVAAVKQGEKESGLKSQESEVTNTKLVQQSNAIDTTSQSASTIPTSENKSFTEKLLTPDSALLTPFSGDLDDLKKAVILILQEKGHPGKKVEIGYQSDDLFMGWTQTYNQDDRKLHHHLKVYRHDPNGLEENKLILHWHAKSSNTCYKISDPNWQIKNADLCELDAKKLKDIHYPIAREILAEHFKHQVYLVALSLGERGYGSKSATYDGKQYQVAIDSESVKVWSKLDDRGLIFECANNSDPNRFKNAAVNQFDEKDYNWFETANKKIDSIDKEANREYEGQRQQERQQQRDRGGDLEL